MLWYLGLILLIIGLIYAVYLRLAVKRIPGIPHLESTEWLYGDLRPMLDYLKQTKKFHPYYADISKQFPGGFFQFNFVAWQPSVVVCDPYVIEDILKKDSLYRRSDSFVNIFKTIIPRGTLSLPTNATWRHHRRLLGPVMSLQNLKHLTPRMVQTAEKLFDLWEMKRQMLGEPTARPVDEGCFEIMSDLSLLSSDVISDVAFGTGYHQLEATITSVNSKGKLGINDFPIERSQLGWASSIFVEALPVDTANPRLTMFFHRLKSASFRKAERIIHNSLDQAIIQGRRMVRLIDVPAESEEGHKCLLDMLLEKELEAEREQGKKSMLRLEEIRDEMATFLLAGDETTASTAGWVMRFLTQNPRVQRKLHQEITDILPELEERGLIYDDINLGKLTYLDAVMQEALRLAQTTMTTVRTNLEETTIHGHVIPKNTEIIIMLGMAGKATKSSMLINSDVLDKPEIESAEKDLASKGYGRPVWRDDENVNSFIPERWIDSDGSFNPNAGPSIPFGVGPRACFGQKLAVLELKLVVLMLSQRYFLDSLPSSLSDPEDVHWKETIVRRPLEVWIRPRLWSEVGDTSGAGEAEGRSM